MKTLRILTISLAFFLGSVTLFATSDGTTYKEATTITFLDAKDLIPQVPALALFDEAEIETIAMISDPSLKFSPEYPVEADFEDTEIDGNSIWIIKPTKKFMPEYPSEADFGDQPSEDARFTPEIPMEAQFHETF